MPRLPLPYAFGAGLAGRGLALAAYDTSGNPAPEDLAPFVRHFGRNDLAAARAGVDLVVLWGTRGIKSCFAEAAVPRARRKTVLFCYGWRPIGRASAARQSMLALTRQAGRLARGVVLMTARQVARARYDLPASAPVVQLRVGIDTHYYARPSSAADVPEEHRATVDALLGEPYVILPGDELRLNDDALEVVRATGLEARAHLAVRTQERHQPAQGGGGAARPRRARDRVRAHQLRLPALPAAARCSLCRLRRCELAAGGMDRGLRELGEWAAVGTVRRFHGARDGGPGLRRADAGDRARRPRLLRARAVVAGQHPEVRRRDDGRAGVRRPHPRRRGNGARVRTRPRHGAGFRRMRILHVIRDLSRATGGPVDALKGLAEAQATLGHEVAIVATDGGADRVVPANTAVQLVPARGNGWFWAPGVKQRLAGLVSASDIVHAHMVWDYPIWEAAQQARRFGKPFILRPCGNLESWSLSQKRLKKMLYLRMFGAAVHTAAAIHYTSEAERVDSAAVTGDRAGFVIPLGVLPEIATRADAGAFARRFVELQGRQIVLFLGRLHPKKQPELAIDAFAAIAGEDPRRHLVLAGPVTRPTAPRFWRVRRAWASPGG